MTRYDTTIEAITRATRGGYPEFSPDDIVRFYDDPKPHAEWVEYQIRSMMAERTLLPFRMELTSTGSLGRYRVDVPCASVPVADRIGPRESAAASFPLAAFRLNPDAAAAMNNAAAAVAAAFDGSMGSLAALRSVSTRPPKWYRRGVLGRLRLYIEPRDLWVGVYVARDAVYVCPLPMVVIRYTRCGAR